MIVTHTATVFPSAVNAAPKRARDETMKAGAVRGSAV